MTKASVHKTVLALLCAIGAAFCAQALPATAFASSSKLASGRWVKISIPDNGVYQITYDELQAMGFSAPQNVRIFGQGGGLMSELLDGSHIDDLQPVPVMRQNNKIIFYGKGPVSITYDQTFSRKDNGYDTAGYYFLTEATSAEPTIAVSAATTASGTPVSTSIDYFWHERDLCTLSYSGRQLLGEDITLDNAVIDFYLPQLSSTSVNVRTVYAAQVSESAQVNAAIVTGGNRQELPYTATIAAPGSNYIFYRIASPQADVDLASLQQRGQLETGITPTAGVINSAKLDYFIITYQHNNILPSDNDNQLRMGFPAATTSQPVMLSGAGSNVVVWNVDNPLAPVSMTLTQAAGGRTFGHAASADYAQYIMFDPAKELKHIGGYRAVENQNLHAMEVPELLIVTSQAFYEQALRVARLHEQVDGIKVAVVEQEHIFNEFSSGAKDPMAVRLLCKMLYDRGNGAFKNLLLLGNGTYDNRNIMGNHGKLVVNYETPGSDSERDSFTTDDFFGFLLDNSGRDIASDKLCIGVGRFTCNNENEARNNVDKLIKYVAEPDYGSWRNNIMLTCDDYDDGLHMSQTEGVANILKDNLLTQMNINKVYCPMFPRAIDEPAVEERSRTSKEGKRHWVELSQRGQYFATYVGHAGPNMFTKQAHMWTKNDALNTSFSHLPIWTTACCDVARYDSDQRGVADVMFHKPDGGCIAVLGSTRAAYASSNDELNRAFVNAMFSYHNNGTMPTLGEAYKNSKLHFSGTNSNKLVFALLGDPAININYPKPNVIITRINGKAVPANGIDVYPMQEINIEADITLDGSSTLNSNFTGDAYASLYGHEQLFDSIRVISAGGVANYRKIYKERELLAEVKGRVNRGHFTGKIIVPRYTQSSTEPGILRIYAHQQGTHNMVNGELRNVRIKEFDPAKAITDTQAPVVESIYFNDENSFGDGSIVASNSTLYVRATDDHAINTQSQSVGNSMKVLLDDGQASDFNIKAFATCSNDGKQVDVAMPVTGMSDGLHRLTFTVFDVAGNTNSRTINFMVGQDNGAKISTPDIMATKGEPVSIGFSSNLGSMPQVDVKVTDTAGRLVWSTTTSSFPITWNQRSNSGQAVANGHYRLFGTYNDGTNFGGTPIEDIIIVDPVKN